MIRINLLPQKREVRRETVDQRWLLAMGGALLLQIVVLLLFHRFKLDELDAEKRNVAEINTAIANIKATVANHKDVKAQLETLRAREEAIGKLQSARTGPTAVLLEIAQVLTEGRGPTVDADHIAQLKRDNPSAVYNPNWDARRLWLSSFNEADRTVKIAGVARDGDDVSELARRLGLSRYFSDVKLLPAVRTVDSDTKLELIRFELQAKALY